jgi:hypothetical protein
MDRGSVIDVTVLLSRERNKRAVESAVLNLQTGAALTSQRQVLGRPLVLVALATVMACQHESSASFDDDSLPNGAGAMGQVAGSKASAGQGAASSEGGTPGGGNGGSAAMAGEAEGGEGPDTMGGSGAGGTGGAAGTNSAGGKAGQPAAGTGGMAGGGGKPVEPEPVTIEIADIDDTYVASCSEYSNYGDSEKLLVDGDKICTYATLLDPALEKIPAGAVISAATLTLTCTNAGGAFDVSFVEETWSENNVRYNNRPNIGSALGSATCPEAGTLSIDVKSAVVAWLAGVQHAYGVYITTEATNGSDFASTEADEAADRPKLSVTYTLAPP